MPQDAFVFHSWSWRDERDGHTKYGEVDFLILHRQYGILVLEAKTGPIRHTDGEWWSGRSTKIQDPLAQVRRSWGQLISLIRGSEFSCFVSYAVWFPHVNLDSVATRLPNDYIGVTLDAKSLENPALAVANIFAKNKAHKPLSEDALHAIRDLLAPNFYARECLRSQLRRNEGAFNALTHRQQSILMAAKNMPKLSVSGTAGTGKTVLAMVQAKMLAASGRVLFLCFNVMLRKYIASQFAAYDVHVLSLKLLHTKSGRPVKDSKAKEHEQITAFLQEYFHETSHMRKAWDYTHVVIDEGQDFYSEHILLLEKIAEAEGGRFIAFFDKKQHVASHVFPFPNRLVELHPLQLTQNCRNTLSIAKVAGTTVNVLPDLMEDLPEGEVPKLFFEESVTDLLARIEAQIDTYHNDAGIPLEQIVILTQKTIRTSVLQDITKIGAYKITHDYEPSSDAILLTTFRKFKGMEADAIILIDIDEAAFDDNDSCVYFYVGASRAKHFLAAIALRDKACNRFFKSTKQFIDAGTSKKYDSQRAVIADALKVEVVVSETSG